jgi:hypothetical protein
MWSNRRIVRAAPDNLSAILAARMSRLAGVKNAIPEIAAEVGDVALYLSGDKADLGFVVEQNGQHLTIFNPTVNSPLRIAETAVIEAARLARRQTIRAPAPNIGFAATLIPLSAGASCPKDIGMPTRVFALS